MQSIVVAAIKVWSWHFCIVFARRASSLDANVPRRKPSTSTGETSKCCIEGRIRDEWSTRTTARRLSRYVPGPVTGVIGSWTFVLTVEVHQWASENQIQPRWPPRQQTCHGDRWSSVGAHTSLVPWSQRFPHWGWPFRFALNHALPGVYCL